MRKQCQLPGLARSTADYVPAPEDPEDIRIKRLLDEIYLIDPCLGSRRLVTVLERDHGVKVNHKRVDRLRREMGHEAIRCKPRTSIPDDGHRKYPYLLRKLAIDRPDQVWCTDITCVPMPRGHAFLCAVMDWHSRKVLGWAVSNTMGTELCLEALEKALDSTGKVPEIFNTDQGCQFTSAEWIARLTGLGVKISMDGRGRWMDNVFTRAVVAKRQIRGNLYQGARHDSRIAARAPGLVRQLRPLAAPSESGQSHPGQGLSDMPPHPRGGMSGSPRRGEIGKPPLRSSHSTSLRSVACEDLRFSFPISDPSPLRP